MRRFEETVNAVEEAGVISQLLPGALVNALSVAILAHRDRAAP